MLQSINMVKNKAIPDSDLKNYRFFLKIVAFTILFCH